MKLLIVTQVVDEKDPYLSFMCGWIAALAKRFENISVVCLKEGEHHVPANVKIYSLGKENGASRLTYIARFYRYAWSLRKEYDTVFIHMNHEYVLLGGVLWRLLRKPVYMWRNHYAGSRAVDVAARSCVKVFCTSQFSYTAHYENTVFMPVGIDAALFRAPSAVERKPRSVLFFARMSPSKHPDVLMEALGILRAQGVAFAASFYGTALPQDADFLQCLKARARELGLGNVVAFHSGVPHAEAPAIFAGHDIYVDLGLSGQYNKMLFEAAASGCMVLAASKDFEQLTGGTFTFPENDAQSLATKIKEKLEQSAPERESEQKTLRKIAEGNSLGTLVTKLVEEMRK